MREVPSTGEVSGPYRLIRVVGSGGMGVVHEAWDSRLDRRVALKMLHPHLLPDGVAWTKFEREARKSARIEHPNVVRIYRVDTHDQRTAIEMQFIEGAPLNTLLRSGPLSPVQAADLLRQLLGALQACHEQGIIHCDLKPGNLMVTRDGNVVLTDFGIARALYGGGSAEATPAPLSGPLWGTPQYSPPESWRGEPVTPRWDLFAAGVLVYEAITGVSAFLATSPAALMHAILSTSPPPLAAVRPGVSSAFSDLVDSMMARDPEARPPSARTALGLLRQTPELGSPETDTEPLPISTRAEVAGGESAASDTPASARPMRSRLVLALCLAPLVALLGLLLVTRLGWIHETGTEGIPSFPVGNDPRAAELVVMQDQALFVAEDSAHGRELWTVEYGKDARLAVDIVPGPGSGNPHRIRARRSGTFVFTAATGATGEELWYGQVSSGEYSARTIKDIIPGPMGSDPIVVAMEDSLVLFYATTLTAGRELWCTNALSEHQTAMVADVFPGIDSSVPVNPRVYADAGGAYIVALADVHRGCVLFRYDYVSNFLREVGDVGEDAGAMTKVGSRLLLANSDETHGWELWVYDEHSGAFEILADLWPGTDSSGPSQFFTWGDRVLFQARTKETGMELWITDGTAAGTNLVADINPGPLDGDPYGFVSAGNHVFFRAKDEACGRELWVTDGTGAGTRRVADLMTGPASGEPYNLVASGRSLFFTANDGVHGEELWWAGPAGRTWQTRLVKDLYPGPIGSEPHDLQLASDGLAYFIAKTPQDGMAVFKFSHPHLPDSAPLATGPEATILPLRMGADHP